MTVNRLVDKYFIIITNEFFMNNLRAQFIVVS